MKIFKFISKGGINYELHREGGNTILYAQTSIGTVLSCGEVGDKEVEAIKEIYGKEDKK